MSVWIDDPPKPDEPTLADVVRRLDEVARDVATIKDHLGAVPNVEAAVRGDLHDTAGAYEKWLKSARKNMAAKDLGARVNLVIDYLGHAEGIITKTSVGNYLATLDTPSKRNLARKTLRPFCRDYMKLGKWIESFEFERIEAKSKTKAVDKKDVLAISTALGATGEEHAQAVWLALYWSGLRAGEVLGLSAGRIDPETGALDASDIHAGKTKKAAVSFTPRQTAEALHAYVSRGTLSYASFHAAVERAKKARGVSGITPKDLRRNFADACRVAGVDADMIDALQGRAPRSVLAKHYTTRGLDNLRLHWEKAANALRFDNKDF